MSEPPWTQANHPHNSLAAVTGAALQPCNNCKGRRRRHTTRGTAGTERAHRGTPGASSLPCTRHVRHPVRGSACTSCSARISLIRQSARKTCGAPVPVRRRLADAAPHALAVAAPHVGLVAALDVPTVRLQARLAAAIHALHCPYPLYGADVPRHWPHLTEPSAAGSPHRTHSQLSPRRRNSSKHSSCHASPFIWSGASLWQYSHFMPIPRMARPGGS